MFVSKSLHMGILMIMTGDGKSMFVLEPAVGVICAWQRRCCMSCSMNASRELTMTMARERRMMWKESVGWETAVDENESRPFVVFMPWLSPYGGRENGKVGRPCGCVGRSRRRPLFRRRCFPRGGCGKRLKDGQGHVETAGLCSSPRDTSWFVSMRSEVSHIGNARN